MRLLRVAVVLAVVLGGVAGCNSDSGGESSGWFGFRNLGKRADSSLVNRAR